jgi:hypothetical protein
MTSEAKITEFSLAGTALSIVLDFGTDRAVNRQFPAFKGHCSNINVAADAMHH